MVVQTDIEAIDRSINLGKQFLLPLGEIKRKKQSESMEHTPPPPPPLANSNKLRKRSLKTFPRKKRAVSNAASGHEGTSEGINFFFSFEEQNYYICTALRARHSVMDSTQFYCSARAKSKYFRRDTRGWKLEGFHTKKLLLCIVREKRESFGYWILIDICLEYHYDWYVTDIIQLNWSMEN